MAVAVLLGIGWYRLALVGLRRDYLKVYLDDCRQRLSQQLARAGGRKRVVVVGSSLVGCGIESGAFGEWDFQPIWHGWADQQFLREAALLDCIESYQPDAVLLEDNLVEIRFVLQLDPLGSRALSDYATRRLREPLRLWWYGQPGLLYGPAPAPSGNEQFVALAPRKPRSAEENAWIEARLQGLRQNHPGLRVSLVDFPVDPMSAQPESSLERAQREAILLAFDSTGVPHWKLPQPLGRAYFRDAGHLAPRGARKFTGWLQEKLNACGPSF